MKQVQVQASNKRIALVYDAIYPYVKGGAERRFYELGKQLTAQGFEVHLYGMKLWDGPSVIERDGMFLHGISKARSLYIRGGRRSMTQPLLFGSACFKLFREKFDVIDCCGFPYFSLFSCKMVAFFKRKPLYATWHEVWGRDYWREYLGPLGYLGYLIERLAVRMPSAFIAASDHTAESLAKQFKPKSPIHVIDNGIHAQDIESIKPSAQASDVIYVGRLVAHKHVDVLLDALELLKHSQPQIRCIIVGDGPERQHLEEQSRRLGLTSNVIFKDFVAEHTDIISLMKASRVFVLPSTREGFGMAALEANAAGIPVVTTNHKDNAARKLINGKNGAVSELTSPAFANEIERCLKGAYKSTDCEQSAERFDWTHIAHKLGAIYSPAPKGSTK